jgi:hypothetical protein
MKLSSPAAQRNRDPILDVLRHCLPGQGLILEIASGSGEHIAHFAAALPGLDWQPSDRDPNQLASINAYVAESGRTNLRPPLVIDTLRNDWHKAIPPRAAADRAAAERGIAGILCINMVHISDWSAVVGLLDGAAALLAKGAPLFLYGPYRRAGVATAPSNEAFDASLKQRNSAWGLRDLETVERAAMSCGFGPAEVTEMPANNLALVFRRA